LTAKGLVHKANQVFIGGGGMLRRGNTCGIAKGGAKGIQGNAVKLGIHLKNSLLFR
jgi:hypothetical protein